MHKPRSNFRESWIKGVIQGFAAAAVIFLGLPVVCAASGPTDETLLFEVHLDHSIISDGLTVYQLNHAFFLPLGETARILTLAISTDPASGTAEGFALEEKRSFKLDVHKRQVVRSGIEESFDPELVLLKDDDIFVESHLFSQWFPVTFNFDVQGLTLSVRSSEPLPIQARLARARLGNMNEESDESRNSLPNYDIPYSWADKPFIDQTVSARANSVPGLNTYATGTYATAAAGDLLGMQANLYLSGSDQVPWDQHRFSLGRLDPDGALLGPLHARAFSMGSISMPGLQYVSLPNDLGTGGLVSSRPLTKPTRFDTQSFSGELLPNWDVELFQNGVPIRHQQNPDNGRYHFDDVPLLFGLNDFRLIFHGPQGQQREEHHRFMLEDSLVAPGEFYYSLGATQMGNGTYRLTSQFDKSVASSLSLTGGMTSIPISGAEKNYFNLGLRTFRDSVFLGADAIATGDGGWLGALGVRTQLAGVNISLSQAVLSNFASEVFIPSGDLATLQTTARFDTFIPVFLRFPFTLELKRTQYTSGSILYDGSGKLSTFFQGLSISDSLHFQIQDGYHSITNELQLGHRILGIGLRGSVISNIEPVPGLSQVDLNAEKALGSQYTLTGSILSTFPDQNCRYEIALNKGVGLFGFGVNAGRTTANETFAGLRLNIALGVEPRRSAMIASAEPMADTGAVSARVFVDRNMNGKFDEGDEPVSGAAFRVDGAEPSEKTDAQGLILLHHLPTKQRVNVVLDTGSVDDPQLTPAKRGVRLVPRSGKVATLDFPLTPTTEIDGSIFRIENGKKKPASDVEVELVDQKGTVVTSSRSAYDGFYILSAVPAGQYQIRVSPAQAERLKLNESVLKEVHVLPNSAFISGIDMPIRVPPPESAQEAKPARPKIDKKSRRGHLFYVAVGSFADPANAEKMRKLLKSLNLEFKNSQTSHEVPVFHIKVAETGSAAEAETTKKSLAGFGFPATIEQSGNQFLVLSGPYYSENLARQEQAFIGAAFSGITLRQSRKTVTLDRFTIGGFDRMALAEEARDRIMATGLVDESLIREVPITEE